MKMKDSFTGIAGVRSHFASAGASRIHYVSAGGGSRVFVFVHGWACHHGFWREQAPLLAEQARLIFIDLPGHGRSDKPEATYTLDAFAEAVQAVLEDAGVDHAVFVGHSMGVAVLCRLHERAPEKFAALISVEGLLCRPPGTPAEARALVAPFNTPHYREHARRLIGSFFPVPGTEELRNRVTDEMLATPQHVMFGAFLGLFDLDQPDWMLRKINAPLLVINAPSPWWQSDFERYVRSLSSRTDYVLMPDVGHFLMLEQPAAFNATLAELLRKHDLIGP
jgi:pimeloyl-ACP methyl ester carboxylesterase